jgi:hypothetical protein
MIYFITNLATALQVDVAYRASKKTHFWYYGYEINNFRIICMSLIEFLFHTKVILIAWESSIWNTYGASEVRLEEYLTKHLPTTHGERHRYVL